MYSSATLVQAAIVNIRKKYMRYFLLFVRILDEKRRETRNEVE